MACYSTCCNSRGFSRTVKVRDLLLEVGSLGDGRASNDSTVAEEAHSAGCEACDSTQRARGLRNGTPGCLTLKFFLKVEDFLENL